MATVSIPAAASAKAVKPRTPSQLAWRRFRRNKAGVFGLIVVAILVVFAFGVPLLAEAPSTNLLLASKAPFEESGYPFGTDIAGRDMVTMLAFGLRTSIVIATAVQLFVVVVSLTLGFLAGWFGGKVDYAVSRLIEVWIALPGLLFQMLFLIVFGPTVINLIIAIALLAWPETTRIVRSQVLQVRTREFIEASRVLGAETPFIALRHIIPNIINPFVIAISLSVPAVILSESVLSFLGYGLSEKEPSLGKMVGVSWQYIQAFWHMAVMPAFLLSMLMLGASFLGDGLRDALDPRGG